MKRLGGSIELDEEGSVLVVAVATTAAGDRVLAHLQSEYPNLAVPADVETTMRIPLSDTAKEEIAELAMEQNLQTLRNRVDELGVAEPVITRQGNDRIVVQLPGGAESRAGNFGFGADGGFGAARGG